MRKIIIIACVLLSSLVLTLLGNLSQKKTDSLLYSWLSDEVVMSKVDNKESFTVYMYHEQCGTDCEKFEKIMDRVLQEQNYQINKINEVDPIPRFQTFLGEAAVTIPALVTIKDGKLHDYILAIQTEKQLLDYIKSNEVNFRQ